METTFKTLGKIGGIGGLALGVLLFLFKDLLKTIQVPLLTAEQWYNTILVFMVLVWSIAIIGLVFTFYVKGKEMKKEGKFKMAETNGVKNVVKKDIKGVKDISIGDKNLPLINEKYSEINVIEGNVENGEGLRVGDDYR